MSGLNPPASSASVIRERIKVLSDQIDHAFTSLAQTLPRLGGELESMVSALGTCGADDSTRSLDAQLKTLMSLGHEMSDGVRRVIGVQQQASDSSGVLVTSAEALIAKLAGIVELSSRLRLVAINASAAAARGGSRAAGFAVLTRELDVVAKTSVKAVPKIREAADGVHGVAEEILGTHSALQDITRDLRANGSQINEAMTCTTDSLAALREALGRALERGRAAERPLAAIMVAAQRQDIVRQKLGHVVMALDEIEAIPPCTRQMPSSTALMDARLLECCWLQSRMTRLIGRLIRDVLEDFEQLCADIMAGLQALDSASAPMMELRTLVPDASVLDGRIRKPAELFQETRGSLAKIAGLLATQKGASERLLPLAQIMRKALSALGDLNQLLGSINVQIKIEMARPQFGAGDASLSQDIDRLRNEYGNSTHEAAHELSMIVRTGAVLSDMSRRLSSEGGGLASLESEVSAVFDGLRAAASTFVDAFERSIRTGASLSDQSAKFRQDLEDMRSAAAEGAKIARQCDELADRADDALGRAPPDVRAQLDQRLAGRLQDLIAKFSVLSHKTAAKDIVSVDVGPGDAPGTLTLF